MKLEQKIKHCLLEKSMSIAVAESMTGGNLQALITSVSGSSKYFLGGVTAYNLDQKVNLLAVDREHAASVNCVSEQVAIEMASGVRKMFNSDIGLATTGYAEPWPDGGVEKPFAWIAIDINGKVQSEKIEPTIVDRITVQRLVANAMLHRLSALLTA
jgi:nicotinamide-nucleotide amidase